MTMFFLRVSDSSVENEDEITNWKTVSHGETVDDVEGFFKLSIENKDSEFHKYKHVEILDEDGKQLVYYFQHDWLPANAWFRLRPPHEQLMPYIQPKYRDKLDFDAEAYLASCGG